MSEYLPIAKVCERLSVSRDTFDRVYRFAPGFPAESFGKRWRWADVDEWMQVNRVSRPARKRRAKNATIQHVSEQRN